MLWSTHTLSFSLSRSLSLSFSLSLVSRCSRGGQETVEGWDGREPRHEQTSSSSRVESLPSRPNNEEKQLQLSWTKSAASCTSIVSAKLSIFILTRKNSVKRRVLVDVKKQTLTFTVLLIPSSQKIMFGTPFFFHFWLFLALLFTLPCCFFRPWSRDGSLIVS